MGTWALKMAWSWREIIAALMRINRRESRQETAGNLGKNGSAGWRRRPGCGASRSAKEKGYGGVRWSASARVQVLVGNVSRGVVLSVTEGGIGRGEKNDSGGRESGLAAGPGPG